MSCLIDAIIVQSFFVKTCIGVDYVLCLDNCQDQLIDAIKKALLKYYGEDPQKSESYTRIINKRHFK